MFASISLFSCDGVWVPDPIDPRLPKLTKDGNNAAGAFVGDSKWESLMRSNIFGRNSVAQIVVNSPDNSLTLTFMGQTKDEAPVNFVFKLNRTNIHTNSDILSLTGKRFLLNDGVNSANINSSNSTYKPANIPGQLSFHAVSKALDGYIISGTFGFTVEKSTGELVEVTYGRFDYLLYINYEL